MFEQDKLAMSLRRYADELLEQGRVYPSGTMKMAADRIEQLNSRIARLESDIATCKARGDKLAGALEWTLEELLDRNADAPVGPEIVDARAALAAYRGTQA